ncbi:2-oxoglutarate and iron-dependent oxygenase domain-containing protein 3-like isoform X1 [Pomacea canaliculata]|uniref:2-oxoglutarate and iron-dependent oxygenase domain-containing protein 3-like isoform X1 n=1 Tax=Pomacea canaliculata TaxID=400727 RepID=UPI000D72D29B|nr:2-oxoglutarate and iron-dependent oxygenase domain-containing protein 3-like isoform X1 [Pomacea canaliculata]XP_025111952.1 2-oxoglutarate and iron-dependent oxygenase domain-containing protein 3-like isoform X1 [Pomacea canaliculata]
MGKEDTRKRKSTRDPKPSVLPTPPRKDYRSKVIYLLLIPVTFFLIRYMLVHFLLVGDDFIQFVGKSPAREKVAVTVPCSADYNGEEFEECKPKKCGRVVMDNLVAEEDARHLLGVAKRGLSLGGSHGGASILDLHSGALSAGERFINIYSLMKQLDEQIFAEEDFRIYRKVKDLIKEAIAEEFEIPKQKLFLTKPTFFSRMNMTPPKTVHDEYWHPHVDKETYGSFHYTSLLYLSTFQDDFDGGRFVFIDKDGNKTVEPRLGRVSFFTSGSENVHFVERLKDGVRYAITVSFTCDPRQAISDPSFVMN